MVIADDRGFGNTKVCVDGRIAALPSIVTRPQSLGLAGIGLKVEARPTAVAFDEHVFAVGAQAWQWGAPLFSLDFTSLVSPERLALWYAALAQILTPDTPHSAALVVGLPVASLQDADQAAYLLDGLRRRVKARHHFRVDERAYDLTVDSLQVLAQPVGAYTDWVFDDELHARKGAGQMEAAVLDIGMNTLDLFAIQGGRALPRYVGGDKVGVRRLLSLLASDGQELVELDAYLRSGRLQPSGDALDIWLGEILAVVERTWPSVRRFGAVIPTGGGAVLLRQRLHLALSAKGAALHWPEDPITANVRGLWKWGVHQWERRQR